MQSSDWFFQPDPKRNLFVPAKAEKLVRKGPGQYVMVGRKPDGQQVELRLTSGKHQTDT